VVPPRCVEEKISLLNVSGQAQTTGGVLFVVARNVLKALISRCLHLINVCAFEVQMVAEDGQKVQYRPHPIANGLVIGKDLTHTVIAHLYTSRLYNTHYITERNSIALAWASPQLQRS